VVALVLAGCGLMTQYSEPVTQIDPKVCVALPDAAKALCKEAGDSLLKGYATLAGHNAKIAQKKEAGIYTREQAQEMLDKSVAARKELDKATEVFKNGDYASALSSYNLTNLLIQSLEKELAKQAAKGN
jgi:hypothetical protein